MAEFDAHASIEDAIEEQAKGRVKKSSDEISNVEYMDIDEMIKADRYRAGKTSSGFTHFGIRMTKLVPPGTG